MPDQEALLHFRTVTLQIRRGKIDEAINLYKSVESEWKQRRGFVSAHLGINRKSGEGISVSVWETLADLKETESSGRVEDVMSRFGPMFPRQPILGTYEAVVTFRNG